MAIFCVLGSVRFPFDIIYIYTYSMLDGAAIYKFFFLFFIFVFNNSLASLKEITFMLPQSSTRSSCKCDYHNNESQAHIFTIKYTAHFVTSQNGWNKIVTATIIWTWRRVKGGHQTLRSKFIYIYIRKRQFRVVLELNISVSLYFNVIKWLAVAISSYKWFIRSCFSGNQTPKFSALIMVGMS